MEEYDPALHKRGISVADDFLNFVEKKVWMAYPPQLQASGEAQGEPSSVPSCLGNKGIQTLLWTGWSCIYTAFKSRGRSLLCSLHNNNNKSHWMRTVWRIKIRTIYAPHPTSATSCKFEIEFVYLFGFWAFQYLALAYKDTKKQSFSLLHLHCHFMSKQKLKQTQQSNILKVTFTGVDQGIFGFFLVLIVSMVQPHQPCCVFKGFPSLSTL